MNPWVKNPRIEETPGPYREGDRVRLLWGVTPVEGVIIEDQGDVSVRGRRFYRVRVQPDDVSEPLDISAPAENLTLVAKAPPPPRKRRRG